MYYVPTNVPKDAERATLILPDTSAYEADDFCRESGSTYRLTFSGEIPASEGTYGDAVFGTYATGCKITRVKTDGGKTEIDVLL